MVGKGGNPSFLIETVMSEKTAVVLGLAVVQVSLTKGSEFKKSLQ